MHMLPPVERGDVAIKKQDFMVRTNVSMVEKSGEPKAVQLELSSYADVNLESLDRLANDHFSAENQLSATNPLFVYYRQNRVFASTPQSVQQSPISEDDIRKQSLAKDIHAIQGLSWWWDKLDAQEARRHRDEEPGYRDPQLEAVRKLIKDVEEFESIGYDAKSERPGLHLKKSIGLEIHIDQLSSGERAYLVLLADLARRLQVIQPDAELADIPGIVLIDEIDLHLHPNWQRLIVPTLTRIFKRCQFIVTTHSPQVLGEIKSGRILVLYQNRQGGIECRRSRSAFGRDSNEILLDVLDSTDRDEDVKARLENLESLINRKELDEARKELDALRLDLESGPVELEIAEQRLRRRERKSKE